MAAPGMTPIPGSSYIASAGYDPDTQTLFIGFKDGARFRYDGVEQETYDGLLSSDSAGKYFHSYIKDQYSARRA